MPQPPAAPPSVHEVFVEHWDFAAGDPVPVWLEHTEGVAQLSFTTDVTVHADLQGGFWVVPAVPTECPIRAVGYGPQTPARIHGQGRGGVRVLSRPPVDVCAYLGLPR